MSVALATFASTMSVETERDIVLATETLIDVSCPDLAEPLPVVFNRRLARALGRVSIEGRTSDGHTRPYRVEFAPFVMRLDEALRREVVIHECAHVIAIHRSGVDDAHGPRWRRTMRELGIATPRAKLHSDDTDPASRALLEQRWLRRRPVAVVCPCGTYHVTPQRAERSLRPGVTCARCDHPFTRAESGAAAGAAS